MTPQGTILHFLRVDRSVTQAELGRRIGLSAKSISAVETGRRRPLTSAEIDKVQCALDLSAGEAKQLRTTARVSSQRIQIPTGTAPRVMRAAHALGRVLDRLDSQQVRTIEAIAESASDRNVVQDEQQQAGGDMMAS